MDSNGATTHIDQPAVGLNNSTSNSASALTPFSPSFEARVVKRSHSVLQEVLYSLEITELSSDPRSSYVIMRDYNDIARLHRYLTSPDLSGVGGCHTGLIVPPLPAPLSESDSLPGVEFSFDDSTSSSDLLAEHILQKDCVLMERCLNLILSHPVLGPDPVLHRFVENSSTPFDSRTLASTSVAPISGVKSWLSWLSRARSPADLHPDEDAFFQAHRVWLSRYQPALQQTQKAFTALFEAQKRLSSQLEHLSTALHIGTGWNCSAHTVCHQLDLRYSHVVKLYKRAVELGAVSGDGTWGERLALYSRYTDAELETMRRRVALLVDYEAAVTAVQKGNDTARHSTMQHTKEALEKCSELAKEEVLRLKTLRANDLLNSIREMAEAQIQAHQIMEKELQQHLSELEDFPITISNE